MLMHAGYVTQLWLFGLFCCLWKYSQASLPLTQDNTGYCTFPEFTWKTPSKEDTKRTWYTRSEYTRNTQTLTKERQIVVSQTEYTISIVLHELCGDFANNDTFPCSRARVKSRVLCVGQETLGKYRVQIQENGKSMFSCLKFIQRGSNIVQVWSADPKEYNQDILCHEQLITRDPWPWLADFQQDWSFCPFIGGFGFRTTLNGDREICKSEWNPSRLETECIKGEGMQFIFQKPRCSVFPGELKTELTLYCWGHWEEDKYIFILLAVHGKRPQLVMRLPNDYNEDTKYLIAYLYYNPICTLKGKGKPSKDIFYLSLDLRRNADGLCYDESEYCGEFAKEGKCNQMSLHERASHCKKSCGLCGDLAPSAKSECKFPEEYQGDWVQFGDRLMESVYITEGGQISFVNLGSYVCKGKHWERNHYKMFSTFNNGCRPRYTCFNFRRDGHALMYQMSRSTPADLSFDICHFKDDPPPLSNRIRSSSPKILLPASSTALDSCGLSGKMEIDVIFKDGTTCMGTISDWDFHKCAKTTNMSLSLHPCNHSMYHKEFSCVAFASLSHGIRVLITEEKYVEETKYNCWMLKTYVEGRNDYPWSEGFMLEQAQCGSSRKFENIDKLQPAMIVTSKIYPEEFYNSKLTDTPGIRQICLKQKSTQKSSRMRLVTTPTRKTTLPGDAKTLLHYQSVLVKTTSPEYGIYIAKNESKDRLLRHSTENKVHSDSNSSASKSNLTRGYSTFLIAFVVYTLYNNVFIS